MNIESIIQAVKGGTLDGIGQLGIGGVLIGLVVSLLFCFCGRKLEKFFCVLFGLLIGAALGVLCTNVMKPADNMWYVVGGVAGALVGAFLAFLIYKVGLAFMIISSVYPLAARACKDHLKDPLNWLIPIAIAAVIAILVFKATKIVVIATSAITGGMAASDILIRQLIPKVSAELAAGIPGTSVIVLVVGALLAAFGAFVQLRGKR